MSAPERSLPRIDEPGRPWAPGPSEPVLGERTVHVWRADLGLAGDDVLELLSDQERTRAARLAQPRDGALWARSRGILRALLGRYLHTDGAALELGAGPHGKPTLAPTAVDSATAPKLAFNLSHSGATAMYAFSAETAVGVDIECERQATNVVALAQRMFGAAEAQRLEEVDADSRQREFFRSWVRYEAELKCLGVGIGGIPPGLEQSKRPWLTQLDTGVEELAAALAVDTQPQELCCWSWSAGA